jgi:hypothetical protein
VSTADGAVMPGMEMPLNRPAESNIIDRVLRRSVVRIAAADMSLWVRLIPHKSR